MKNSHNQFDQCVSTLWTLLHDEWRLTRKKEDGTFEPRLKTTKDSAWIEKNGTTEVDIANTLYVDLPEDRQYENKASAEVAIKQIYQTVENQQTLDESFVEAASAVVHEERLKRNAWVYDPKYGNPVLTQSYENLPEEEKEKDRVIVRMAIEIYEKNR